MHIGSLIQDRRIKNIKNKQNIKNCKKNIDNTKPKHNPGKANNAKHSRTKTTRFSCPS